MTAPAYAAPLIAVDQLAVVGDPDGGLELRATKVVSLADPYMEAHFPDRAVYPGVFILETVRQAALAALGERDGVLPDLSEVRSLRFRSALGDGERLTVTAVITPPDPSGSITVRACCRRDDGSDVATLVLALRYEADPDA